MTPEPVFTVKSLLVVLYDIPTPEVGFLNNGSELIFPVPE